MSRITKASYATLAAVTIAHFLNHVYTGALSPFLPLIQIELSLNYTEIGIITSAAIVTMTTSHLLVGYLGDRGGRWRDIFISSSILMSALAMLLASISESFFILALFQAFLGIGASGYHPSVFPELADKFPQHNLAKAIGIQAMGGLIGTAVIPSIGVTLLVVMGGWRPSLVALGIIGFVILIPVFLLMRLSRSGAGKIIIDINDECKGADGWTRNYWLGLILMGLRGMSFRCTTLLMPVYLIATYTSDLIWAGYLTTILLSAGLIGEIISAPLSDRFKRRVPFLLISSGISAPALLLLNYTLNQVTLVLVLIIIGFFYYFGVPPIDAFLTEVCPRDSRGLAFGLLFSVGSMPGALSPIIFGLIGDTYGLPASILFLVLTTTLATIVSIFLKEIKQKEMVGESILYLDPMVRPD